MFNPGNWDTPKTISVVALDDSVAERPATRVVRVQHAVISSDPKYGKEVTQADMSEVLECTIEEDDKPGVLLSAGALSAKRVRYCKTFETFETFETFKTLKLQMR